MKYFTCNDGLIAWVDLDGNSNHSYLQNNPENFKIQGNVLSVFSCDGALEAEYILWDSLIALAVEIEKPVHSNDESMNIDAAVAAGHYALEKFRSDWHSNHAEHPEKYPLSIEHANSGVFSELMCSAIEEVF